MVTKRVNIHSFIMRIIIMSIIVVNITSAVSAVPTSKVPNSLKVIGTTLYVKKSYAAKPTRIQLQQVVSIIKKRLDYMGVKKRTFNIDENSGEIEIKLYTTNLTYINKPVTLISEIIKPSIITFQDVYKSKKDKNGDYLPTGKLILSNNDITTANLDIDPENAETVVALKLNKQGSKKFFAATTRLAKTKGTVGIFFDNELIMECRITQPISESEIQIGGGLTFEQARNYTNLINSGGLPFKLSYKNLSVK